MKTLSKVLNKEFNFVINHLGLFINDDLWIHDKYIVLIDGQDFEYHTGVGYRVEKDWYSREKYKELKNKNTAKNKTNLLLYIDELKKVSKPKPLNIDDVLHSLILDSQFSSYSFEDFCNELGYNEDSIKHNEIYKDCQKTAKKVKAFINNIDEASELFQDY
jgi:hypothetical protein